MSAIFESIVAGKAEPNIRHAGNRFYGNVMPLIGASGARWRSLTDRQGWRTQHAGNRSVNDPAPARSGARWPSRQGSLDRERPLEGGGQRVKTRSAPCPYQALGLGGRSRTPRCCPAACRTARGVTAVAVTANGPCPCGSLTGPSVNRPCEQLSRCSAGMRCRLLIHVDRDEPPGRRLRRSADLREIVRVTGAAIIPRATA